MRPVEDRDHEDAAVDQFPAVLNELLDDEAEDIAMFIQRSVINVRYCRHRRSQVTNASTPVASMWSRAAGAVRSPTSLKRDWTSRSSRCVMVFRCLVVSAVLSHTGTRLGGKSYLLGYGIGLRNQTPSNSGSRLSRNALTPSWKSSVSTT